MTQQYIIGEFSLVLAGLQPVGDEVFREAVGELRHEVERGPLAGLPRLAREAMSLADSVCWAALERGDVSGFRLSADAAVALRELTANANLMR